MTSPHHPSNALTLHLTDPGLSGTGHSKIRLTYGSADFLDLTLQRKFRVPEDGNNYSNTARNGALRIYPVEQFAAGLPEGLSEKGGLIVPMFNREAASLHFRSSRPYAVKIFVGGNNCITGEPLVETSTTLIRQKRKVATGQMIQDYYLTGEEKVDVYHTLDGKEKQFVTGTEMVIVQVMPLKRMVGMTIFVRKADGSEYTFSVEGLDGGVKIEKVKERIWASKGIDVREQMLVLRGVVLDDSQSLSDYEIRDGSIIHLLHHTHPCAENDSDRSSDSENPSIASSTSRSINFSKKLRNIHIPDWDKENTLTFNLQFINATVFENLVGVKTKTPLVMGMFKEATIPIVREIYNEDHSATLTTSSTNSNTQTNDINLEAVKVELIALAKANKKLKEIQITKVNGGEKMPEFLLEEEMMEKVKDAIDDEWTRRMRAESRGALSTWPKEVVHRNVSPDRGEDKGEELFDLEL